MQEVEAAIESSDYFMLAGNSQVLANIWDKYSRIDQVKFVEDSL